MQVLIVMQTCGWEIGGEGPISNKHFLTLSHSFPSQFLQKHLTQEPDSLQLAWPKNAVGYDCGMIGLQNVSNKFRNVI